MFTFAKQGQRPLLNKAACMMVLKFFICRILIISKPFDKFTVMAFMLAFAFSWLDVSQEIHEKSKFPDMLIPTQRF